MNTDTERDRIWKHLERKQQIEEDTREAIRRNELEHTTLNPLEGMDPDLVRSVEEEFYASQGRKRHISSTGRVLWLTDDELADRKRRRKKELNKGTYYGPTSPTHQRTMMNRAFKAGAVCLAVLIVYLFVL